MDFLAMTCTSRFSVTDPEKLKSIVRRIWWACGLRDPELDPQTCRGAYFDEQRGRYAFGAYDYICGIVPEDIYAESKDELERDFYGCDLRAEPGHMEDLVRELQEILPPDEVIIIEEVNADVSWGPEFEITIITPKANKTLTFEDTLSEVLAMFYILLAAAFLVVAAYLNYKQSKEEEYWREYGKLRHTRPESDDRLSAHPFHE